MKKVIAITIIAMIIIMIFGWFNAFFGAAVIALMVHERKESKKKPTLSFINSKGKIG